MKDPTFCRLFPDMLALHNANKLLSASHELENSIEDQKVVTLPREEDDLKGILAAGAAVVAVLSLLFALRFM